MKKQKILKMLREIRECATMESADFSKSIKEQTELWRESWIISPLDEVIKMLEEN